MATKDKGSRSVGLNGGPREFKRIRAQKAEWYNGHKVGFNDGLKVGKVLGLRHLIARDWGLAISLLNPVVVSQPWLSQYGAPLFRDAETAKFVASLPAPAEAMDALFKGLEFQIQP